MPWDPERQDRLEELEPIHYDVPDHLKRELWHWTLDVLQPMNRNSRRTVPSIEVLLNALRFGIEPTTRYNEILSMLTQYCSTSDGQLNTARAILKHLPDDARADRLEAILVRGRSGYAVKMDKRGLEYRVLPIARRQVEGAVTDSSEAVSQRLVSAWNMAYDIEPDPANSYSMAIKAVEAAYRPILNPEGKADLTAVIPIFEAKPSKWELMLGDHRRPGRPDRPVFDSSLMVLDMLKGLSYGETKRHPTESDVEGNTVEEARAAVQLAVTLVQWANSGAFRRVVD